MYRQCLLENYENGTLKPIEVIFHQFVIKQEEHSQRVYCLIETDDGSIKLVPHNKIRFVDNPRTRKPYEVKWE